MLAVVDVKILLVRCTFKMPKTIGNKKKKKMVPGGCSRC